MGVYLDYQATSPMPESIREVYLEALAGVGNPSSIHQAGQRQRSALEGAKERIAAILGCEPIEIILTSGGTEADNHAVNTVPKECLVRITKAEDGGLGGKGIWKGGTDGFSPGAENEVMKSYLAGDFATSKNPEAAPVSYE